jgi:hypothetical protein
MPSVFQSYIECGGETQRACLCLIECECAFPSVSVVASDGCDSAVSCISSDDSEVWPLKESHFYLGHVPRLNNLLSQLLAKSSRLTRERTIHGLYCEWHNTSVRLASRIFGELQ